LSILYEIDQAHVDITIHELDWLEANKKYNFHDNGRASTIPRSENKWICHPILAKTKFECIRCDTKWTSSKSNF
jgi:hypothetical protein